MAVYAVGDLQGCYSPFRRLLERLDFDPARDRLWLVGDLVNRGPESLACLRFVRDLGDAAVTVLGNHDLALLRKAHLGEHALSVDETLKPVLAAPDCGELLDWLRRQKLFHHDPQLGWSMVHAGLAPDWDIATAGALAAEVAHTLAGPDYGAFLDDLYGNEPDCWSPGLAGTARLRTIVNVMTRMRLCRAGGVLDLDYKGSLEAAPAGLVPWFALPGRASAQERVVFGHWSALGRVAWPEYKVWGVDTGCVWGGALTALRLDSGEPGITAESCAVAGRGQRG